MVPSSSMTLHRIMQLFKQILECESPQPILDRVQQYLLLIGNLLPCSHSCPANYGIYGCRRNPKHTGQFDRRKPTAAARFSSMPPVSKNGCAHEERHLAMIALVYSGLGHRFQAPASSPASSRRFAVLSVVSSSQASSRRLKRRLVASSSRRHVVLSVVSPSPASFGLVSALYCKHGLALLSMTPEPPAIFSHRCLLSGKVLAPSRQDLGARR